jgi:putative DNA primase/helicase
LRSIDAQGRCTCGKDDCQSPGKHPRTKNGLKDGTTDEAKIRGWWQRWPNANVGIVTGRKSGLLVLDIDPRHGGEDSLKELEKRRGAALPSTVESLTGGRGRHLIFQHPDEPIHCAANLVGLSGIDLRADGGYIVAPPSIHVSGNRYSWPPSSHPAEVALAPVPAELLKLIQSRPSRRKQARSDGPIPQGERNVKLTSLAGQCRRRGLGRAAILAELLEANERRCTPPLPQDEVERIADSVSQYPVADAIHRTDLGNAKRFAREHSEVLRHCQATQAWMGWDQRRWRRDRVREAVRCAEETIRAMYAEARGLASKKTRRALARHAMKSEAQKAIAAMLELAKADRRIAVVPELFDAKPTHWLLNVLNGSIDLKTGLLREHRPSDFITKLAPVTYDPQAKCLLWERFLERVVPDPEVRAFLQRFAGYALTGDASEQVFALLYGTGSNGKSTFLETLKAMLGDYAYKTDFEIFLEGRATRDRKGAPRQDLLELAGRRMVIAVEAGEGRRLDANTIKEITGGDTLTARGIYHRDQTSFRPQAKLLLATNHRPEIRDATEAIWRRVMEVGFGVTIPEGERDPNLLERLQEPAELSGILNWAIEGCLAWQAIQTLPRLHPPDSVRRATASYRENQDVIAPFLSARCIQEAQARIPNKEFRAAYLVWCEESEEEPMSQIAFTRALEEHGFRRERGKDRNRTKGWRGIRLRDLLNESNADGSDGCA